MSEWEDEQLGLGGMPAFDIWDQQVDETDAEYEERMEKARLESEQSLIDPVQAALNQGCDAWKCACGWIGRIFAMSVNASGGRVCPQCGASGGLLLAQDVPKNSLDPLPNETDIQYDQRVDQQRDEQAAPVLTACPAPTQPMTIEALEQMAAAALQALKDKKAAKRNPNADGEWQSPNTPFVQESFISNVCTAEGGTGDDCMMCNGSACRFCGRGCWDKEAGPCTHNETERHTWNSDPAFASRRLMLQEVEMIALGISEARRKEMMDKIFDGDPSRPSAVYCVRCKREVKDGEVVNITSTGARHMKNCLEDLFEPT